MIIWSIEIRKKTKKFLEKINFKKVEIWLYNKSKNR